MAVFLFALTGIPPFSGFIGKLYLFAEVINQQIYWLVVIAALNSVVGLYYYARIVKSMFLDESKDAAVVVAVPAIPRAMIVLLVVPTLILGVYWEPIVQDRYELRPDARLLIQAARGDGLGPAIPREAGPFVFIRMAPSPVTISLSMDGNRI